MDGPRKGLLRKVVNKGVYKGELVYAEIFKKAGHAAYVACIVGFHQHHAEHAIKR